MDPWVGVGSAIAILIIVLSCLGPHDWKSPSRWTIPDIGAAFFIFVGANSITEAVKIGRLLALGRIVASNGRSGAGAAYATVSAEDAVFFVGGVAAGLIVGLITIRDGIGRIAQ
jgi:hypothetical protein